MDGPRLALAPYLAGTLDSRSFSIDGCLLFVSRGPMCRERLDHREVHFLGEGRDGDFVPPGSPAAAVFERVLCGLPGLVPLGGTGCAAESEEALARAETALLAAAGRYGKISRSSAPGELGAVAALLRAPRLEGRRRSIGLDNGGLRVTVECEPGAGGARETVTVRAWAHGRPVGDRVPSALAAVGACPDRVRGAENSPEYALPPALVEPFLDALCAALGPRNVHVTDG